MKDPLSHVCCLPCNSNVHSDETWQTAEVDSVVVGDAAVVPVERIVAGGLGAGVLAAISLVAPHAAALELPVPGEVEGEGVLGTQREGDDVILDGRSGYLELVLHLRRVVEPLGVHDPQCQLTE